MNEFNLPLREDSIQESIHYVQTGKDEYKDIARVMDWDCIQSKIMDVAHITLCAAAAIVWIQRENIETSAVVTAEVIGGINAIAFVVKNTVQKLSMRNIRRLAAEDPAKLQDMLENIQRECPVLLERVERLQKKLGIPDKEVPSSSDIFPDIELGFKE